MPYKNPEDQKRYAREHYRRNAPTYKARAVTHKRKVRANVATFLLGYLKENPCVDCGEADPVVLEFDHRPGEEKLGNIGNVKNIGWSLDTVKAEIAKCDVRCANCHRRATYQRAKRNHRGVIT